MALPKTLVFVRHAESEGNIAHSRSRHGDDSAFTPEFRRKPDPQWRLTDLGRKQARFAGDWIRQHVAPYFSRYFTSEYARTLETAALLDFPRAQWERHYALREKSWGVLTRYPDSEKGVRFPDVMDEWFADPMHWRPPNGVSIADMCHRLDRFLEFLAQGTAEERVLVVCHGEVILAFRLLIEGWTSAQLRERMHGKDRQKYRNLNTQVVEYTRLEPESGALMPRYRWMRSTLPGPLERPGPWRPFERTTCSNDDLLKEVRDIPRLIR